MKSVTVRLADDLVAALDTEVEEGGLGPNIRNRTEYVRLILKHREAALNASEAGESASETDVEGQLSAHADRLDVLEDDVTELRGKAHRHSWSKAP